MKIATYNIWNSESLDIRQALLLREIEGCAADIIGLQEVPRAFYQAISALYPHSAYEQYEGEDEGLAIFSRYPILQTNFLHGKCADALHTIIEVNGLRLSVTNVHLPWQSILAREKQIIAVNEFIHGLQADYSLLLGDFNGSEGSSVHRFLVGDQSLNGCECAPVWLDITDNFARLRGTTFPPTLDCIKNPRWKTKNTIYAPQTMDRIYVLDNWKPLSFDHVHVFGTQIDPASGLCPSDHYGVLAYVSFD